MTDSTTKYCLWDALSGAAVMLAVVLVAGAIKFGFAGLGFLLFGGR